MKWDVPVLIVGAGPAGLVSSLALSRYGVEHMLVERHPGTAHTPRAHIVDQRTVEILRHLGVEDRFHAVATPQELMRNNLWVTSLAGQEIIRTETWGTSARVAGEYQASSPCPMANCPQTAFEPMLVDALRDAGSDVMFRHELETLQQDADGVTSTVRGRLTGEPISVRSQYVIGADGARSRVLDLAGLTIDGPAGLANAASVWFEADLTRYLAHRPGVLTWSAMPGPLPQPALDAHLHHRPTTRPGARAPHARLERDATPISTLDLVDGLGFALLTGPGGQRWVEAAADVAARTGVPITVHVIGRGTGGPADPYGEWAERREVDCDGCVLVRPDRHVAWRYPRFDATAPEALRVVMERVLARGPVPVPRQPGAPTAPATGKVVASM